MQVVACRFTPSYAKIKQSEKLTRSFNRWYSKTDLCAKDCQKCLANIEKYGISSVAFLCKDDCRCNKTIISKVIHWKCVNYRCLFKIKICSYFLKTTDLSPGDLHVIIYQLESRVVTILKAVFTSTSLPYWVTSKNPLGFHSTVLIYLVQGFGYELNMLHQF